MAIKLINPFLFFRPQKSQVNSKNNKDDIVNAQSVQTNIERMLTTGTTELKTIFNSFSIGRLYDGVFLKYRANDGTEYCLTASAYNTVSLLKLDNNSFQQIHPDMIWYPCNDLKTEEINITRLKLILLLLLDKRVFDDYTHSILFDDGIFDQYDIPVNQAIKDNNRLTFDITSDEILAVGNLYDIINIWMLYAETAIVNVYGPIQFQAYDVNNIKQIILSYEKFSSKKIFKDKLSSGCNECKSAAQLFFTLVGIYVFSKCTTDNNTNINAIKLVDFHTAGFSEMVNEIQSYVRERTGYNIVVKPKSIGNKFIPRAINN